MPKHTFKTRRVKGADQHETEVSVPGTTKEWAAAGWDPQAMVLAAATVKVQNAMREYWDERKLDDPKKRVEFVRELFGNGGQPVSKGKVSRRIRLPESERENEALIASMESQGYVVEFEAA